MFLSFNSCKLESIDQEKKKRGREKRVERKMERGGEKEEISKREK